MYSRTYSDEDGNLVRHRSMSFEDVVSEVLSSARINDIEDKAIRILLFCLDLDAIYNDILKRGGDEATARSESKKLVDMYTRGVDRKFMLRYGNSAFNQGSNVKDRFLKLLEPI